MKYTLTKSLRSKHKPLGAGGNVKSLLSLSMSMYIILRHHYIVERFKNIYLLKSPLLSEIILTFTDVSLTHYTSGIVRILILQFV